MSTLRVKLQISIPLYVISFSIFHFIRTGIHSDVGQTEPVDEPESVGREQTVASPSELRRENCCMTSEDGV